MPCWRGRRSFLAPPDCLCFCFQAAAGSGAPLFPPIGMPCTLAARESFHRRKIVWAFFSPNGSLTLTHARGVFTSLTSIDSQAYRPVSIGLNFSILSSAQCREAIGANLPAIRWFNSVPLAVWGSGQLNRKKRSLLTFGAGSVYSVPCIYRRTGSPMLHCAICTRTGTNRPVWQASSVSANPQWNAKKSGNKNRPITGENTSASWLGSFAWSWLMAKLVSRSPLAFYYWKQQQDRGERVLIKSSRRAFFFWYLCLYVSSCAGAAVRARRLN